MARRAGATNTAPSPTSNTRRVSIVHPRASNPRDCTARRRDLPRPVPVELVRTTSEIRSSIPQYRQCVSPEEGSFGIDVGPPPQHGIAHAVPPGGHVELAEDRVAARAASAPGAAARYDIFE